MTDDARIIERIHQRAYEIREKHNRIKAYIYGGAGAGLLILTVGLIKHYSTLMHPIGEGYLTGSSMLGENAGAYVLVALIAFMFGAGIMALIKHYGNKGRKDHFYPDDDMSQDRL